VIKKGSTVGVGRIGGEIKLLAPELFFLILSHPVCKMSIIH